MQLEEAKLRSERVLEVLRWVYVPIFSHLDGMCAEMRPEFNRDGSLPQRVCGTVYLDGIRIPPDDVAALPAESLHAVMIVPPELHLMTLGFERSFQETRGPR